MKHQWYQLLSDLPTTVQCHLANMWLWKSLPQLKNMTSWYKVVCGCEWFISTKIMHWSLLSQRRSYLKNLNIKVVMQKIEGLMKFPIKFLRHIKIMSCHMVSIYSKQYMIWIWKKCVHINHQNMHYHIWNVFCVVVNNVHVFISQVQNNIITIHMSFQK